MTVRVPEDATPGRAPNGPSPACRSVTAVFGSSPRWIHTPERSAQAASGVPSAWAAALTASSAQPWPSGTIEPSCSPQLESPVDRHGRVDLGIDLVRMRRVHAHRR